MTFTMTCEGEGDLESPKQYQNRIPHTNSSYNWGTALAYILKNKNVVFL